MYTCRSFSASPRPHANNDSPQCSIDHRRAPRSSRQTVQHNAHTHTVQHNEHSPLHECGVGSRACTCDNVASRLDLFATPKKKTPCVLPTTRPSPTARVQECMRPQCLYRYARHHSETWTLPPAPHQLLARHPLQMNFRCTTPREPGRRRRRSSWACRGSARSCTAAA